MSSQIKHIALADDDDEDVEIFQLALNEVFPDIKLDVARNGEELMQLLDIIPLPDLIILDINMPFKSGIQCLQNLRLRKKFDEVPIAILSTSNSQEDIKYCLSKGAAKYFTKPANYAGMKKMIVEICSPGTYGNKLE